MLVERLTVSIVLSINTFAYDAKMEGYILNFYHRFTLPVMCYNADSSYNLSMHKTILNLSFFHCFCQ